MPIQLCIAPSKPHDVETSTEANFRNEIEPQAVPDSYTTNVDDSPYVEKPFQDSGSSYAPSKEYGSDSTSDAMEKAPDEEQESSRDTPTANFRLQLLPRKNNPSELDERRKSNAPDFKEFRFFPNVVSCPKLRPSSHRRERPVPDKPGSHGPKRRLPQTEEPKGKETPKITQLDNRNTDYDEPNLDNCQTQNSTAHKSCTNTTELDGRAETTGKLSTKKHEKPDETTLCSKSLLVRAALMGL
ncbi:hypothetical protein FQA39_LY01148 [Lamprigera yunnana]|nr:hypothetical protein FQA39_LY01148 [Lamprigera yunnana]